MLPELIGLDEWGYPILPTTRYPTAYRRSPAARSGSARPSPCDSIRPTGDDQMTLARRHRADEAADETTGETTGGAAGNERLTAMTGAVLIVLFAAEGFTILLAAPRC